MFPLTDRAYVKRRKALTRVVCLILCAAVWVVSVPAASDITVSAETVDELTAQKDAYASKQEELEAQRDDKAATLEEQKEQAAILQEQIAVKSKEITANEELISTLDTEIADKTAAIAEQEATIASLSRKVTAQYAALQQRLRAISKKSGTQTTLQLILSSRHYRDYLIGFKLSERIAEHDQQLMDSLEEDMATIEQTKKQNETDKKTLESERTTLDEAKKDMQTDKSSLQEMYQEADALADEMAQDVEYLDEQIAILDEEQAYIQARIGEVMARLEAEEQARKEAEEQARKEAEEQARKEAEEQARKEAEEAAKQEQEEQESEESEEDSSDEDTSSEEDGTSDESSEEGSDSSEEENTEDGNSEEDESDDSPDYTDSSEWIWPAPTCLVITSSYKYREQFGRWHYGLDIACYGDAEGEPIVAVDDGTVVYTNRYDEWGGGYGLYLMIDHGYNSDGERILTLYSHCSEVTAYEGLEVEAGDTVGYVGNTGNSFGAHLHFEVQVDGSAVDPAGYLPMGGIDILG